MVSSYRINSARTIAIELTIKYCRGNDKYVDPANMNIKKKERGLVSLFNGISTFVGYLNAKAIFLEEQ